VDAATRKRVMELGGALVKRGLEKKEGRVNFLIDVVGAVKGGEARNDRNSFAEKYI